MESPNFKRMRSRLGKTQKELARLLGVSIKAVHSYEQGWRKIPAHVERQLLFLLSRTINDDQAPKKCWDINQCPENKLESCPAWEFKAGELCWFINGTQCSGKAHKSWEDKMEACKICNAFLTFFKDEQGIFTNE